MSEDSSRQHKHTAYAWVRGESGRTCNDESCTYLVICDVDLLDHFRDSIFNYGSQV
jgi:hypothetical protein